MAAAAPALPALSPRDGALEAEDSNMSSPLSEVEDKDGDPDEMDGIILQSHEPQDEALDSDSNLSEANDTEAETERLYDTPQNPRHKDVIVNQFHEGSVVERTPSKLGSTILADSIEENGDDESLSDDEMSVAPSTHPGDVESPTKTVKSTEPSSVDESKQSFDARKRKRSPIADQSDSEGPLRKRTASIGVAEAGNNDEDNAAGEDDATSAIVSSAEHSPTEEAVGSVGNKNENEDTAQEDDTIVAEAEVPVKLPKNGSKQKQSSEGGADDNEPDAGTEDDAVPTADEGPAEGDAEAEEPDPAEKNDDEEAAKKRMAMEEWSSIEEKFSIFRDRLYKDRLDRLEQEEASLTADVPYHPEYLNMKQCVDERLAERLKQINKEHEYTLEAHERVGVARKAEIWGQFYQAMREKREEFLDQLNKDWYDTQNARRSAHSVQDFSLVYPANDIQRTRNAVAYNTEVSILSGIAKHVGFPAAPAMRGASAAEIEEDLEAIKRARRQRQQSMMQPPVFSGSLDPAGEQFIRNTPWANPQHPRHQPHKAYVGDAEGTSVQSPRVNGQSQQSPSEKTPNRLAPGSLSVSGKGNTQMKRVLSLQGAGSHASKSVPESVVKHETAAVAASS